MKKYRVWTINCNLIQPGGPTPTGGVYENFDHLSNADEFAQELKNKYMRVNIEERIGDNKYSLLYFFYNARKHDKTGKAFVD